MMCVCLVNKDDIQLVCHSILVMCKSRCVSILQFWLNSFSCCDFRSLSIMVSLIKSYS